MCSLISMCSLYWLCCYAAYYQTVGVWFTKICFCFYPISYMCMSWIGKGTAIAQWLRCCATDRKVAGSIPPGVNGFFIDIKSFQSHYGPVVNSASRGGRCVRLATYHHPVPLSRGSTVVKVLCFKSEGCWFNPSWCQWIFHWHKIFRIALWLWGRLSL